MLARLDLSKLEDAVAKSRATLAAAEAQVLQAQATVAEARANLARFQQVSQLSGGKVPSQSEMDTAEANLKRAEANVASARASVAQARATLQSDETNLAKASIRSPIDGVVLARKVEPGQTVAASFQAPVLFTLAEDLTKMELQVDVDEADVGQVQGGPEAPRSPSTPSPAASTPPSSRASATARRTTDGVVSYLDRARGRQRRPQPAPGHDRHRRDHHADRAKTSLLVPNAALRFTPRDQRTTAEKKSGGSVLRRLDAAAAARQTPKVAGRRTEGDASASGCCATAQPVAVAVRPAPPTAG